MLQACLRVPSGTINKAKKIDFAAISHKLLDMRKHKIIDSIISTENIPDTVIQIGELFLNATFWHF